MTKVLALSSNYEPLGVIDWQRAVTLLFSGKVQTLHESDQVIRSPSWEMRIPTVVAFRHSRHKRVKSVRFSRKNVWIRDEGRCQYCNSSVSIKDFTLDHVQPRTTGGQTMWTNVVTCCTPCNQKKADKPLNRSGLSLLKHPCKPVSLPYVQDVESFYDFNVSVPDSWKFWLGKDLN